MNHRKICLCAMVAFTFMLSITGCNNDGMAVENSSSLLSSLPESSSSLPSEEISSSSNTSEPIAVEPLPVSIYGVQSDRYQAYLMNGKSFFTLETAAGIFDVPISYEKDSQTVSIGDPEKAYIEVPIPELTMFPSISLVTGLPANGAWTNGKIVDYVSLTKGVPFDDILPQLKNLFKQDGFMLLEEEAFSEFIAAHTEFSEGNRENTWFRYTNGEGSEPDVAQILDGGVDDNEIPIIKVRFYPASQVKSRESEPIEGMEQGKIFLYGEERNETAYLLDGAPYLAVDDTLTLFGRRSFYSQNDNMVYVAQAGRENVSIYFPDISMFPNFSHMLNSKAVEVYCDAGELTLWYQMDFETEFPKIREELLPQGFALATEEDFEKLATRNRQFSQGIRENTFTLQQTTREEPIGLQFSPSQTSQGDEAVAVRICV